MSDMKAAFIETTGGPDVIQVGTLPRPVISDNQILVKVKAVAVNPIDTYIRNGANYWPLKYPFVIGSDFAGEIAEVGRAVDRNQYEFADVGRRVWGSNQGLMGRGGSFAEYIAIDPAWAYPTPQAASDEDAAACALVGITAALGLFEHATINSDDTIFVRGGTGGVGSMVLQMAAAQGCRVITTAGSREKADRCRTLGATEIIEYNREDTASRLAELAPDGVDVYWETLREPRFDEAVAAMAENARMILMAGRDARPPFPVGPFYVKGCRLLGFVMFKASPEQQRRAAGRINDLLAAGRLQSQIDRVMPIDAAAQAHRLQEDATIRGSGELAGKLVLTFGG